MWLDGFLIIALPPVIGLVTVSGNKRFVSPLTLWRLVAKLGWRIVRGMFIFRTDNDRIADRLLGPRHGMAFRLPSVSVSKNTILAVAQLVLNVSLGVWLYNEYLHNRYMQEYMAGLWSTVWPEAALAFGIAVGAISTLSMYRRGHLNMIIKTPAEMAGTQAMGASASLATIDMCPFCDTPLKTISEGRLQCRSCRRYFKSSLPKIAA